MIRNELDYGITKAPARKLQDALAHTDELHRKGKYDATKLRFRRRQPKAFFPISGIRSAINHHFSVRDMWDRIAL